MKITSKLTLGSVSEDFEDVRDPISPEKFIEVGQYNSQLA